MVMVLLPLVLVLAFSGYFQVSSHRRMFERLYARRVMLLAAESAFEEVCAVIEGKHQTVPPLPADVAGAQALTKSPRNLRTMLALPPVIVPELARKELERHGVEL